MTATQLFLFGIMVAWTPSLIVLAWLLQSAASPGLEDRQNSLYY
jgi:hypothetical protein